MKQSRTKAIFSVKGMEVVRGRVCLIVFSVYWARAFSPVRARILTVCWHCHNKYHSLHGLTNKHVFPHNSVSYMLDIQVSEGLVAPETYLSSDYK
jgi:hypothetical protein